jgi:hypothetical protein
MALYRIWHTQQSKPISKNTPLNSWNDFLISRNYKKLNLLNILQANFTIRERTIKKRLHLISIWLRLIVKNAVTIS